LAKGWGGNGSGRFWGTAVVNGERYKRRGERRKRRGKRELRQKEDRKPFCADMWELKGHLTSKDTARGKKGWGWGGVNREIGARLIYERAKFLFQEIEKGGTRAGNTGWANGVFKNAPQGKNPNCTEIPAVT